MKRYLLILIVLLHVPLFSDSKIAIVTMAIGEKYQDAVSKGIQSQREYCKRYGYDFYYLDHPLCDRAIPWNKVLYLIEIMEKSSHEWLYWMDADSLIMNTAINMEDFIDEDYSIIITHDHVQLNTGQFFIRNSPEMKALLLKVYDQTQFLTHSLYEQPGYNHLYENDPKVKALSKVVPQRLFNSFCATTTYGYFPKITYQPGDFLFHFAGVRDCNLLKEMFADYTHKVIDSLDSLDPDYYLGIYGFHLCPAHSSSNEGYMTEAQKQQFADCLRKYDHIESVVEIGLNGGHSAYTFMQNCPKLKHLLSFDINHHPYTKVAVEYFSRFFKDKFTFVPGNSLASISSYSCANPEKKYDLIYIDGSTSYETSLCDILNCRSLAHSNTILWIDDYHPQLGIGIAIDYWAKYGLIEILAVHKSHDSIGGYRKWVEAKYLD